ncbi:MAG TPA: bestrophin family ion channel [Croceibacterium sp.]|nr:bestrophin family ion channel [Croceibacterium sp.]
MIIRDKPTKLELAFAVRGSIVPAIAPRLALLMVFSAAMVWLHDNTAGFPEIDAVVFTVFGIALSLFLGFRNNAAYDRWWEARKLWGGLLADLRSLAREVQLFVPDQARQKSLIRLSLAFIHLHRANLRKIANDPRALELGAEFMKAPHPPCAALDVLSAEIASARHAEAIDGFGAKALQERLASLTNQQAGCERIVTTPLPYVYSLLIYRTTYLYCLLLPFALIGPAGWMTPLFVGIVAYVFLGLAEVTEDLSHPFGTTPNALPLDAICRAVEISLAPHLGEEAPKPLRAKNFYLS